MWSKVHCTYIRTYYSILNQLNAGASESHFSITHAHVCVYRTLDIVSTYLGTPVILRSRWPDQLIESFNRGKISPLKTLLQTFMIISNQTCIRFAYYDNERYILDWVIIIYFNYYYNYIICIKHTIIKSLFLILQLSIIFAIFQSHIPNDFRMSRINLNMIIFF